MEARVRVVCVLVSVACAAAGLRCPAALDRTTTRWTLDCSGLSLGAPPAVHLHPVTTLDMSHNLLRHLLPSQFTNFTELTHFNLSHNSINMIDNNSFFGLVNLFELNLSFNKIEVLSHNITNHLTKLKILNLSSNRLKTISPGAYRPVVMLVKLFLGNNIDLGKLTENYKELSESLSRRLIFLDLANTSLTEIPESFFSNASLINLNIALNPIKYVPSMSPRLRQLNMSGTNIENLLPGDFVNNDALQKLYLENMPLLSEIKAGAFHGLNHLEELSIRNCHRLNFISENAFGESSPKLQKVVISNCSVETLPKTFEQMFSRVQYLDLQFNPWLCDGDTDWLVEITTASSPTDNLRCSKPDAAKGMLLLDYFKRQTRSYSTLVHTVVVAALLTVLVVGVVAMVRHMTKQEARAYRQIQQDISLQQRQPNTLPPL